ncbi:MAG TPA: hypothetical protein VL137_15375 [Polyangiaceae bacterium]|nr:hypothetical protein [Polyangiaceae bacterium]
MRTLLAATLVLSFAAWLTLHVVLVARLLFRSPRWMSLLALLPPLAPLAPYWGYQTGLRRSAISWGAALAAYAVALAFAYALGQ